MAKLLRKAKICKVCEKEFLPYTTTQPVCSFDCLIIYNSEKEVKKRVKAIKKGLLTHSDYTQVLQELVNKIVRNIDTNFPCISSGRTTGQMHGGHLFPTSSYPEIRFNLFNIWKQSASDNKYKSGNINDYRANLTKLFGKEAEYIFELQKRFKILKLSSYELQDKIKIAKQIIKEQNEGLHIAVSSDDRLTIRSILNKRLNIYN